MTHEKCLGCHRHIYGDCPDNLIGAASDTIGYECLESGKWKLYEAADLSADPLVKRILFLRKQQTETARKLWNANNKLAGVAAAIKEQA